jgi:hypothetical protein
MNFRTGLFCSYLGMLTTAALAQEPSGHIDLDAVSEGQFPHFVAATIPFVDTDSQCPERRETLRFSEGISRLVDFLPAGVAVVGPSGEKIFGRGPANAARHSGPIPASVDAFVGHDGPSSKRLALFRAGQSGEATRRNANRWV